MDENALDLKNSFAPIPWTQIEQVVYKAGKHGNVVGIKLKNIRDYTHQRLPVKNRLILKINKVVYGCDFCITSKALENSPSQMYDSVNDFFIRTRLSKAGWLLK